MLCAECQKEGEKSQVYEGGMVSTCMGDSRFYDEEGVFHWHDPNGRTTSYRCSRGHSWSKTHYPQCPAPGCDWVEQRAVRRASIAARRAEDAESFNANIVAVGSLYVSDNPITLEANQPAHRPLR